MNHKTKWYHCTCVFKRICSPDLLHGRFQPAVQTDLWCVWRSLSFGHLLRRDFFLALWRKSFFCESSLVTKVIKWSVARQSCMTLFYLSFPRSQVSKLSSLSSRSYHHLITQLICSPPSNTDNSLLINPCNCWCGKAAPRTVHIFYCLLMIFCKWKWQGAESIMSLKCKKKRVVWSHQRASAQSSVGQGMRIYFLETFF